MPGTLDDLTDRIRAGTGAALPVPSFLYQRLCRDDEDLTDAKHIGRGVINGVECDHLAFRTPDVDWQIWIQVGPRPIPRKYVITSKGVTGAPQYTIQINDWRTDVPIDANNFVFNAPQGATKVRADQLKHVDEVPPGVSPQEGKK